MRVLVVSNAYPPLSRGGYEACCELVVEHLRFRHDVLVLTAAEQGHVPGQPWVHRRLPRFSQISGDTVGAPLATARAIRRLRSTLAAFAPQVGFVWNASGLPFGAIRLLELSGVPLVFSVHDPWFGEYEQADPYARYLDGGQRGIRRAWTGVVRGLNRLPGLRVSLSGDTRAAICWNSESLRRRVEAPSRISPVLERTIHPATPHERALLAIERRPRHDGMILFIGRVEWVKGPDLAYRVLAELRARDGHDWRLVLAGAVDPRLAGELEALSESLGLRGRIELKGPTEPAGLAQLYAEADVLLVPSRWQEPFGLVALEGAMARIPVVAARSGALPEVLVEGEHGLFFDIEDVSGAADAVASVLRDTDATAERVERAFARACTFSIDRYVRETERFLTEAVELLR